MIELNDVKKSFFFGFYFYFTDSSVEKDFKSNIYNRHKLYTK